MSGVDPTLLSFVEQQEGFSPRAKWDYKQNSVGYGTKADYPGQVVTRDQAASMLANELASRGAAVNNLAQQYGYNFGPAQQNALTSFSYNLGQGALNRVLQKAGGDASQIPSLMSQYVNVTEANGSKHPLSGLVSRRNAEVAMFTGGPYAAAPSQTVAQPPTATAQANAPVASLPATLSSDTAASLPPILPNVASVPTIPKLPTQFSPQVTFTPVRNDSVRIAQNLPELFFQ